MLPIKEIEEDRIIEVEVSVEVEDYKVVLSDFKEK